MLGTIRYADELSKKTEIIMQTLYGWNQATPAMVEKAKQIKNELDVIKLAFNGYQAKASWEEVPPGPQPLNRRLNYLMYTHNSNTSALTKTEKDTYQILKEELPPFIKKLKKAGSEIETLQKEMQALGAPWLPGQMPEL
ncbi:MAG: hypothetical protein DRI73_11120 [Bacteroidetes bacterium]|nr:MAG: hypothetical protein DRI73_11120 [Bacteroidota bacterium]